MIIKVRAISTKGDNAIVSRIGSVLRMKVKTTKISTEANDIIKEFLIDFFDVPPSGINIIKGNNGKEKTIEVRCKSEEELKKVMDAVP